MNLAPMKLPLPFVAMLVIACLFSAAPASAQEKGQWRAASKTANSITGDVGFTDEKIYVNYSGFTLAQIRTLSPAESAALFETQTEGTGNLFRTIIPGGKKFLHKNTLCGTEDTQWVATWVSGHTLQLAFFSGTAMPILTAEALAGSSSLCGTYTYVR